MTHVFRIRTCRFSVSGLYWVLAKSLVLGISCVLHCVMVIAGEIILWNTRCERVHGYEILLVAMGMMANANRMGNNNVDGDLPLTYANNLISGSRLYCTVKKRLKLVFSCDLYCLVVLTDKIRRQSSKIESVRFCEWLRAQ